MARKMNNKLQKAKYIVWDAAASMFAWALFFAYRKVLIEHEVFADVNAVFRDRNLWTGLIVLPLAWLTLYTMQGTYRHVYRKARLKEFNMTLLASLLGVVIIFFVLLLDDNVTSYKNYYLSFIVLFAMHFSLTYTGRLLITSSTVRKIHRREIGFPTLLVGGSTLAYEAFSSLEQQEIHSGNAFVGYLSDGSSPDPRLQSALAELGTIDNIDTVIDNYGIEEVIFATDTLRGIDMLRVVSRLMRRDDVVLKAHPKMTDMMSGKIKMEGVFHTPLVYINRQPVEDWQLSVKRAADILLSGIALIFLSPIFLITAIIVKTGSPGPIFYAQERIGYRGKPFMMYKFRSMYIDAEASGPLLSTDEDPRVTPFGRFMRKYRLDETPQFFNVLIGNMSLVGPRPERQYYIDKIVETHPEYHMLQRMKPGLTSWGQVKYGYASTVDEMIKRMRYDLLYLDNMSIATDIKIILYTVIIIIQGRGK